MAKSVMALAFIFLTNYSFAQDDVKPDWQWIDSFYWFHYSYNLKDTITEKDTAFIFEFLSYLDTVRNNNTFCHGIGFYGLGIAFPFQFLDLEIDRRGKDLWIERKNMMTGQRLFIKSECFLKLHGYSFFLHSTTRFISRNQR